MAIPATVGATFEIIAGTAGYTGTVIVVLTSSSSLVAGEKKIITQASILVTNVTNIAVSIASGVNAPPGAPAIMVPGTTLCKSSGDDILVEGDEVTVSIAGVNPSGAVVTASVVVKITDAGQNVLTTG